MSKIKRLTTAFAICASLVACKGEENKNDTVSVTGNGSSIVVGNGNNVTSTTNGNGNAVVQGNNCVVVNGELISGSPLKCKITP